MTGFVEQGRPAHYRWRHSLGLGPELCPKEAASRAQHLHLPPLPEKQLPERQLLQAPVALASHRDRVVYLEPSQHRPFSLRLLLSEHLIPATGKQQKHVPNSSLSDFPASGGAEPYSAWKQGHQRCDRSNCLFSRQGSSEVESQKIPFAVSHVQNMGRENCWHKLPHKEKGSLRRK